MLRPPHLSPKAQNRSEKSAGLFWLSFLREQPSLGIIAVTALLAPLLPAPATSVRWHGAQTLGVELGMVLLLMTLLYRVCSFRPPPKAARAALVLPLSILCALLLWGVFSCVYSGGTAFAIQGLVLLASGVLVTDTVSRHARTEQGCLFLTDAVMAGGLLVAFSGIALYGSGGTSSIVGVLHDHNLFGACLMLVVAVSLAVMLAPVTMTHRLFAQATLLVCVTALVMAQARSSWIGGLTALLAFGGLLLSARGTGPRHGSGPRRSVWSPQAALFPALTILVLGCFLWLSPERGALFARARTMTTSVVQGKDEATQWRLAAWAGAKKMIRQKPLTGWGIGSYTRHQNLFTQTGRPAQVVARDGPTISDETHNSYLQIWAEMGLVGIALWLLFLASLFVSAVPILRGSAAGSLEQYLVIGGLSAVAGQMVDALANPAWQFGHIMLPFWIIVGLTLSPLRRRATARAAEVNDAEPGLGWPARLAQLVVVLMIGGSLVWIILRTAFALPSPYL